MPYTIKPKPDPCYCKRCDRMVPLSEWSGAFRKAVGRMVWRDRCRLCVNAYQQALQSTPEGKARVAAMYKRRKSAGLIKALPWSLKTPEQRQRVADTVRAFRLRNHSSYNAKDRQYKALRRHPGYMVMGHAVRQHYDNACLACKRSFTMVQATWDHVRPLCPTSPPADNDWPNLQPLCRRCNTQKRLLATDYRPDGGAWIIEHLLAHPELSTQSLALYRRPGVTRLMGGGASLKPSIS